MIRIIITCSLLLASTASVMAQQPLRLSQQDCRERAIAHSEDLQQANNAIQQAKLDRKIANTAYLPNLEGSATGAYVLPDIDVMGSELRMRGMYMAGITLTQPIYTGGSITTGRRLAQIGEKSAAEQERLTRMEVIADADNAYWTYIAVRRKVQMTGQYKRQMDTLYRQTQTAVQAGMATDNDLLRIEAQRSNLAYQLQRAENGADLCRMSLCRIIGVAADTPILPTDTIIQCAVPGSLDTNTAARPELRLLQMQVDANEQQVRMSQSKLLPTVGLSAGYTYYGNIKMKGTADAGDGTLIPYTQEFRDGIGMAMLAVQIPIFHWGEGHKKVRRAQYDLENARLELQKNSRLLDLELQQAIRNVQDGYRLITAADIALRQAEENLRVMRNRYAASMSPLTDLLDAQSQWQEASSNLIEAQTQYKIYETEYLRAAGWLAD